MGTQSIRLNETDIYIITRIALAVCINIDDNHIKTGGKL